MSISNRLNSLESKHLELEAKIRQAYLHHQHEDEIILLKKQKLLLKDAIENLHNKTG